MGEVIRLGRALHRVRLDFKQTGTAAIVDVKRFPTPGFISAIEEQLESLYPLLVEQEAVLFVFAPANNIPAPTFEVRRG